LRTNWSNEAAIYGFNGAVAAVSLDILALTVLSVFGRSVALNLGGLISIWGLFLSQLLILVTGHMVSRQQILGKMLRSLRIHIQSAL
jgi:hypothetical protein